MRKSLEDIKHMVRDIPYPAPLPADITNHQVYLIDSGHSIMCVLAQHWNSEAKVTPDDYEVPVPVKYVLERGYRKHGDYIIVDAPYDRTFGLDVPDEYSEF